MTGGRVQVKKIKAYPLPASVKIGTAAMPAQIVKLTVQGFLMEFSLQSIRPGDKIDIWFEVPVLKHSINEPCVVVKLYNQWAVDKAADGAAGAGEPPKDAKAATQTPPAQVAPAKVLQLVECHFVSPQNTTRERIQSFLNAIGRLGTK